MPYLYTLKLSPCQHILLFTDKVNITLKDNSVINVYFDNNTKEYSKEKKVTNPVIKMIICLFLQSGCINSCCSNCLM